MYHKMKTIFFNALLLLLLLSASVAQAQDTRLYSFSLRGNGQFLTIDHQGSLTISGAQTEVNRLTQLFIIKQLSGGGALILSAANPDLFLKRNGSSVVLTPYTPNDVDFEWELRYAGFPYLSLAAPGTDSVLSWQAGSGFTMTDTPAALSNNADASGDAYRFAVTHITNTF